ncbi:MAG: sulfotransferase [Aestuariivirga sp.]|nr:sulfotransferase [Aestuariivirga sp.]
MSRLPDFIIIGSMKSATTTLYRQLAAQPHMFLSNPKEPNFFSNDEIFAKGISWYSSLFDLADGAEITGEASTHYTKLPTYPHTVERMSAHFSSPRLIYVMRHPIDRLVSQYIHQWSEREIVCSLGEAVVKHPELVAYSRYAYQLGPFFEAFGKDAVLPVFFESLAAAPQKELERVCRFIGYTGAPVWQHELTRENISERRIRKLPFHGALIESGIATALRRTFVPKPLRKFIATRLTIMKRPSLPAAVAKDLVQLFDDDLGKLDSWLGRKIRCETFRELK